MSFRAKLISMTTALGIVFVTMLTFLWLAIIEKS